MNAFLTVLQIFGALGVFLFGMKVMSEALQKVAGQRLKSLLGRITSNRVKGVVTGFSITAIIQSSSATTVMVVSFVNAGLLTLKQSIGVIMGANIGTTVTGWLVALIGFKVKLSLFALPAVGFGVAMTFLRGARIKQWGEVLLGFGLLFLGLSLLKKAVPDVGALELVWLRALTEHGYGSLLFFVGIGTGLTVVLQSSSATMTLTLTLTATGLIPYECAVAMILGENIGTTVTANLAAIGASTAAKRAARAHFLFNVVGVIWALALFYVFLLPVVDWIVPGDPMTALKTEPAAAAGIITAHLAAFHTLFNVVNTLLLLPFVNQIEKVVSRWVKDGRPKERHVARYVSTALVETPELLLVQVGKELQHMTQVVKEMFDGSMQLLTRPGDNLGSLVEDTLKHETIVDGLEREITGVLTLTARAATSASAAREIAELAQNAHRLERVGDHCEKLVYLAVQNHEAVSDRIEGRLLEDIVELGKQVGESIDNLGRYLVGESTLADAERIEKGINQTRDRIRARHVDHMTSSGQNIVSGLRFLDIVVQLEEIGDRTYGIIRRAEETETQ